MFTDNSLMPFGIHKGKRMEVVPAEYLDFIHDQHWITKWPEVLEYIKKNKNILNAELDEHRAERRTNTFLKRGG